MLCDKPLHELLHSEVCVCRRRCSASSGSTLVQLSHYRCCVVEKVHLKLHHRADSVTEDRVTVDILSSPCTRHYSYIHASDALPTHAYSRRSQVDSRTTRSKPDTQATPTANPKGAPTSDRSPRLGPSQQPLPAGASPRHSSRARRACTRQQRAQAVRSLARSLARLLACLLTLVVDEEMRTQLYRLQLVGRSCSGARAPAHTRAALRQQAAGGAVLAGSWSPEGVRVTVCGLV